MGMALGWITIALAAVAAAPEAGRGGAPIKYTVRFVEAEGLGWRDAVYTRLTPVTRQGAATVWTAPSDVAKRLESHAMKTSTAEMHQVPTVIARPGTPAHITTTRASFPLVTQVAWNGDDRPAEARRETVRTGSAATMAGRKLDQGVLVQMVLKDTQMIAVHRVALGGPKAAHTDPAAQKAAFEKECTSAPGCCQAAAANEVEQHFNDAWDRYWGLGKYATRTSGASSSACQKDGCCEAAKTPKKTTTMKWSLELKLGGHPGIALPPGQYSKDGLNVVPTGPACPESTCATQAEAAKVAPGLAVPPPPLPQPPPPPLAGGVVAAPAAASECCASAAACGGCSSGGTTHAVAVEVPEIGSEEIAGEWLIPTDGILLVSFGPHTVADKDGKAVIRERLAIIEAEEAPEALVLPRPSPSSAWPRVPDLEVPVLPAPAASVPAPAAATPNSTTPNSAPAAGAPIAMPPMPSRSFPQGYHADGKAAALPPLPADEADDEDDDESSESAEARPSPQMKTPRHPGRAEQARPRKNKSTSDASTKKAQFSLSGFPVIPSLFQPAPAVGLQFLIPIKPVSLKLPFNRRLELEIYGRVVRNPEPARSPADLAAKPACETTTK